MPIFKYFAVVGSALFVLLFVSDACLRDSDNETRFDGSLFQSAIYAPLIEETVTEPRFTHDATPADRIREVFTQFVPNEGRRSRRYASASHGT